MYLFCLFALSVLMNSATWGQANYKPHKHPGGMSAEEAAVRNSYANLRYGAELGVLVNAVIYDGKKYADAPGPSSNDAAGIAKSLASQITFDVSDVRTGDINKIKDKPVISLVTEPTAEAFSLNIEGVNYSLTVNAKSTETMARWLIARWKTSEEIELDRKQLTEISDKTIAQILAKIPGNSFSRYASFSVHASLQGKAINYSAIFLFPKANSGDVWAIDMIAGGDTVSLGKTSFYPGVLLETTFREIPTIQSWLDAHSISSCPGDGMRSVCCDPNIDLCGISREDLLKAIATPVDPESRQAIDKGRIQ